MNIQKQKTARKFFPKLEIISLPWLTPYIPGILLFIITLAIALLTYKDYGVSWDEGTSRDNGLYSYNYIFHNDQALLTYKDRQYGVGFELVLVFIEKWMNLTDSRDIFLMRHLVTHVFFLISAFSLYVLALRLFKNKYIASLGLIMLVFTPRIYAHSFFNSKDIPSLCMFIIAFTVGQIAFDKNKPALFLLLGAVCGYTTSVRIMGIMLAVILLFFLIIDGITAFIRKEGRRKSIYNPLAFITGFCVALYAAWPYLWSDPLHRFIESYKRMSHFNWEGTVYTNGKFHYATEIPWTHFPIWFLITNPELWLVSGLAGMIWIIIDLFKKPLCFLKNTRERNFLLYLCCFGIPIFMVIILHAVIYDDWRHLYFVYPSFILMVLYFINKLFQTRYSFIIKAACILQAGIIAVFMIQNYPFQQVYFNHFVSHKTEYLRKNYDLDYWACSYKQGIDHILESDTSKVIGINCEFLILLDNAKQLLHKDDRKRVRFADMENADYFITNFRFHLFDSLPYRNEYSIAVLNSTIMRVYKMDKSKKH